MSYSQQLTELAGLAPSIIGDPDALAAVLVAAAGAMGLGTLGPPIVRKGPDGYAAGLICGKGHIVLHANPDEGSCLVDIVARSDATVDKGLSVIARRFGVEPSL